MINNYWFLMPVKRYESIVLSSNIGLLISWLKLFASLVAGLVFLRLYIPIYAKKAITQIKCMNIPFTVAKAIKQIEKAIKGFNDLLIRDISPSRNKLNSLINNSIFRVKLIA